MELSTGRAGSKGGGSGWMDRTTSGPRIRGSVDRGTSGRDGEIGVWRRVATTGDDWHARTREPGFVHSHSQE